MRRYRQFVLMVLVISLHVPATDTRAQAPVNVLLVYATESDLPASAYNQWVNFTGIVHDFFGVSFTYLDYNKNVSQFRYDIQRNIYAGHTSIVFGIGARAKPVFKLLAPNNPNIKFVLIDSVMTGSNVASALFNEQEGAYLAGAVAAMVTHTKEIAVYGANDTSRVYANVQGFREGARSIDPNVIVNYAIPPQNPTLDSWNGNLTPAGIVQNLLNVENDVIYSVAGLSNQYIFRTIAQKNNTYYRAWGIGYGYDQDAADPGIILTSMVKRYQVIIEYYINQLRDFTWTANQTNWGIASGAISMTDMAYVPKVRNTIYNTTTGQTIYGKLLYLEQQIGLNQIRVDSKLDTNFTNPTKADVPQLLGLPTMVLLIPWLNQRRKKYFDDCKS